MLRKQDFEQTLAFRPCLRTAHWALHWAAFSAENEADSTCLGVVLPKKWAKKAVTRNGLRRQLYQVFSQYKDQLPQGRYVIRQTAAWSVAVYPSAWSDALRWVVRQEIIELIEKARDLKDKIQKASRVSMMTEVKEQAGGDE